MTIKRIILGAFTLFSLHGQAAPPKWLSEATTKIDGLLKEHVTANGGVAYTRLNQPENQKIIADILKLYKGASRVGSLSENEKLSAYINLYNIGMIRNLLKYTNDNRIKLDSARFLQVTKINKISVPGGGNLWNGSYKLPLGSTMFTLDEIEHGLIRGQKNISMPTYKIKKLDPRIHAAVNCAAMSCPRLLNKAYTSENVQQMLSENMTAFVSSPAQFKKINSNKMQINKIIYWYYGDFESYGKSHGMSGAGGYLASFIQRGSQDAIWKGMFLRSSFNNRAKAGFNFSSDYSFEYDWRPNDVRNRK